MFKYFTVAEANEILPEVAKRFKDVSARRAEVTSLERRMQGNAAVGNMSIKSYMEIKQDLNAAVTNLYHSIAMLESMGVSLKGVDEGLVDFPSRRFDDDVWLCWKSGESEIKFWHDIDSGFMGRKPIEVSDESLV